MIVRRVSKVYDNFINIHKNINLKTVIMAILLIYARNYLDSKEPRREIQLRDISLLQQTLNTRIILIDHYSSSGGRD